MRIGQYKSFCSCLLKNEVEHVTEKVDGQCVYCGYFVMDRKVTRKDMRTNLKYRHKLRQAKEESLSVFAKERRHREKIN